MPDRVAEHDLSAVRCRGDTSGVVDGHADEVVVVLHHLADMDSHTDPQAETVGPFVGFDGPLRFYRGCKTGRRRIEGKEERVALRAVLGSAGMLDCRAHDPPVMTEERGILRSGAVE